MYGVSDMEGYLRLSGCTSWPAENSSVWFSCPRHCTSAGYPYHERAPVKYFIDTTHTHLCTNVYRVYLTGKAPNGILGSVQCAVCIVRGNTRCTQGKACWLTHLMRWASPSVASSATEVSTHPCHILCNTPLLSVRYAVCIRY